MRAQPIPPTTSSSRQRVGPISLGIAPRACTILSKLLLRLLLLDGRHREAGVRVSSADWLKAGVARQRAGPISLGIAPRTCTILSKLVLLLSDDCPLHNSSAPFYYALQKLEIDCWLDGIHVLPARAQGNLAQGERGYRNAQHGL